MTASGQIGCSVSERNSKRRASPIATRLEMSSLGGLARDAVEVAAGERGWR
jgi:hypothetical protein